MAKTVSAWDSLDKARALYKKFKGMRGASVPKKTKAPSTKTVQEAYNAYKGMRGETVKSKTLTKKEKDRIMKQYKSMYK